MMVSNQIYLVNIESAGLNFIQKICNLFFMHVNCKHDLNSA